MVPIYPKKEIIIIGACIFVIIIAVVIIYNHSSDSYHGNVDYTTDNDEYSNDEYSNDEYPNDYGEYPPGYPFDSDGWR